MVGYASKYGSTEKVAQTIAETLKGKGMAVELIDLGSGSLDPAGYDLVVLGSRIMVGSWDKKVLTFIDKNKDKLLKANTAMFAVCGDVAVPERVAAAQKNYIDDVVAKTGLTPRSSALFGGRIDLSLYGFVVKAIMRKQLSPLKEKGVDIEKPLELRDWDAIRAWADKLA